MVRIDVPGVAGTSGATRLTMWPYWMVFLALAMPAIAMPAQAKKVASPAWYAMAAFLVLFIGFRHQVGGDWLAYIRHFDYVRFYSFSQLIFESDPGYAFINWWMQSWGLEIYSVNLICALIFMVGLSAFARRQPYPWIAIAVAFPYLVLVVAMGYSRQGVALGFILLALNSIESRQFNRYIAFIILATLFHKTALVMIPLGIFMWGKGKVFRAVAIAVAAYVLFDLLVAPEVEGMWDAYVDRQMLSQGAQIRVFMNLVPALILLFYRKIWQQLFTDYAFWFWIAAGSIGSIFLVGFASTAVDRMALYFLPIQLVVFSRLPCLIRGKIDTKLIKVGIILGYTLVLFVWLNYANNAFGWLPYRNIIFV